MNKIVLIGRLGQDAALKVFDNGGQVLNFSIATSEKWKDKTTGEKKEKTEWHNCSLHGDRGAALAQYLLKGTQLAVEGSVTYRKYEKDGVKCTACDIRVQNVEFVGDKKSEGSSQDPKDDGGTHERSNAAEAVDDSDVPF